MKWNRLFSLNIIIIDSSLSAYIPKEQGCVLISSRRSFNASKHTQTLVNRSHTWSVFTFVCWYRTSQWDTGISAPRPDTPEGTTPGPAQRSRTNKATQVYNDPLPSAVTIPNRVTLWMRQFSSSTCNYTGQQRFIFLSFMISLYSIRISYWC